MDFYKLSLLFALVVFGYFAIFYKFADDFESEADRGEEGKSYEKWLEEVEKTNIRITETCQKYGKLLTDVKVNHASLLYNPDHQVLMCRNAKVNR